MLNQLMEINAVVMLTHKNIKKTLGVVGQPHFLQHKSQILGALSQ
jgi:hypothetical protein